MAAETQQTSRAAAESVATWDVICQKKRLEEMLALSRGISQGIEDLTAGRAYKGYLSKWRRAQKGTSDSDDSEEIEIARVAPRVVTPPMSHSKPVSNSERRERKARKEISEEVGDDPETYATSDDEASAKSHSSDDLLFDRFLEFTGQDIDETIAKEVEKADVIRMAYAEDAYEQVRTHIDELKVDDRVRLSADVYKWLKARYFTSTRHLQDLEEQEVEHSEAMNLRDAQWEELWEKLEKKPMDELCRAQDFYEKIRADTRKDRRRRSRTSRTSEKQPASAVLPSKEVAKMKLQSVDSSLAQMKEMLDAANKRNDELRGDMASGGAESHENKMPKTSDLLEIIADQQDAIDALNAQVTSGTIRVEGIEKAISSLQADKFNIDKHMKFGESLARAPSKDGASHVDDLLQDTIDTMKQKHFVERLQADVTLRYQLMDSEAMKDKPADLDIAEYARQQEAEAAVLRKDCKDIQDAIDHMRALRDSASIGGNLIETLDKEEVEVSSRATSKELVLNQVFQGGKEVEAVVLTDEMRMRRRSSANTVAPSRQPRLSVIPVTEAVAQSPVVASTNKADVSLTAHPLPPSSTQRGELNNNEISEVAKLVLDAEGVLEQLSLEKDRLLRNISKANPIAASNVASNVQIVDRMTSSVGISEIDVSNSAVVSTSAVQMKRAESEPAAPSAANHFLHPDVQIDARLETDLAVRGVVESTPTRSPSKAMDAKKIGDVIASTSDATKPSDRNPSHAFVESKLSAALDAAPSIVENIQAEKDAAERLASSQAESKRLGFELRQLETQIARRSQRKGTQTFERAVEDVDQNDAVNSVKDMVEENREPEHEQKLDSVEQHDEHEMQCDNVEHALVDERKEREGLEQRQETLPPSKPPSEPDTDLIFLIYRAGADAEKAADEDKTNSYMQGHRSRDEKAADEDKTNSNMQGHRSRDEIESRQDRNGEHGSSDNQATPQQVYQACSTSNDAGNDAREGAQQTDDLHSKGKRKSKKFDLMGILARAQFDKAINELHELHLADYKTKEELARVENHIKTMKDKEKGGASTLLKAAEIATGPEKEKKASVEEPQAISDLRNAIKKKQTELKKLRQQWTQNKNSAVSSQARRNHRVAEQPRESIVANLAWGMMQSQGHSATATEQAQEKPTTPPNQFLRVLQRVALATEATANCEQHEDGETSAEAAFVRKPAATFLAAAAQLSAVAETRRKSMMPPPPIHHQNFARALLHTPSKEHKGPHLRAPTEEQDIGMMPSVCRPPSKERANSKQRVPSKGRAASR